MSWRISPLGDRALVAELAAGAADESWVQVGAAAQWLRQAKVPWMIDLIPAYTTVTIVYDPVRVWQALASNNGMTIYEKASKTVEELLASTAVGLRQVVEHIHVPVCYGGEYGPDLEESAERSGVSADAFVEVHSSAEYTVALVGFVPGFPYLAGLPPQLAQPRRVNPRARVPAGTVAIGGGQTGIYPLEVPGGWQLIGRTPLRLFDAARPEPALLRAGDRIRFFPISEEQFRTMEAEVAGNAGDRSREKTRTGRIVSER
ncbi:5-oxoprolinase subunit PxpB [Paenibacillus sp. PR3]|uniref:5-oxoprolinase subunit PxpB n=1 Tax=Paenibacillus terricola TaxID=2763503 RepID=A0ABR8MVX9_9BACL|nr:5-oxoprolinase subunit PxpB [Paenibacillus terricola]MBD3920123.1 5-oxoprolinase subunit PxpB [Paenibacillus terricola]